MYSSTVFSEAERYKFNTSFRDGYHQHIIPCESGTTSQIWRRVKHLGRGAFGTVWLESEEKGQLRAVKRIAKTSNSMHLRELLTLAKLKVYPKHFVRFLGWFESDDDMFFAMEYIKHGDLSKLIRKTNVPMPEDDVKSITRQLLDGLRVMHENNFCHRDLKPENILVVSLSPIIVKICDFGVSKHLLEGTDFRTTVGTGAYIAPEVWGFIDSDTSVYTCAVDIWSLGCLIYNLLAKETPFPDVKKLIDYVEARVPFPIAKLMERKSSAGVIKFIVSLMMAKPEERLTAKSALNDPWLANETAPSGFGLGRKTTVLDGRAAKKAPHICIDLYCAARHGNLNAIKQFVGKGAKVRSKSESGQTALHSAAAGGHCGVVSYLLNEGANIMSTGINGETPLHSAASAGRSDVVKVLIDWGADIMAKEHNGHTPLYSAAAKGYPNVVGLLLEGRANILATNKYGKSIPHGIGLMEGKGIPRPPLETEPNLGRTITDPDVGYHPDHSWSVGAQGKRRGKGYKDSWIYGIKGWAILRVLMGYKSGPRSIFENNLVQTLGVTAIGSSPGGGRDNISDCSHCHHKHSHTPIY